MDVTIVINAYKLRFGGVFSYNACPLRIFFERTFRSVKSINYACAVKNDTPLFCTVKVKVQMGS